MIPIALRKFQTKDIVRKGSEDNFFYRILSSIYPQRGSKKYEKYKDLFAKSAIHGEVEDLYNVKLALVAVTFVLYVSIVNTNIYYRTDEILSELSTNSTLLLGGQETSEEQKAEEKILQVKEKEVYYTLESAFGDVITEKDATEEKMVVMLRNYIELNGLQVSENETSEYLATRMYTKMMEMKQLESIDWFVVAVLLFLVWYIPEMYFVIRRFLISQFIYGEYLQLEVSTIMVGKLEPIKVEEILTVLSQNSKYFKIYIDGIRLNYFGVRDGYEDAFGTVIAKVENKELKYLLKALQQAAEGDLKKTIENLENQRLSNKEFRNIKEQNKLKQKDLFGILIVLIALVIVSLYAFAPFGEILTSGLDLGI